MLLFCFSHMAPLLVFDCCLRFLVPAYGVSHPVTSGIRSLVSVCHPVSPVLSAVPLGCGGSGHGAEGLKGQRVVATFQVRSPGPREKTELPRAAPLVNGRAAFSRPSLLPGPHFQPLTWGLPVLALFQVRTEPCAHDSCSLLPLSPLQTLRVSPHPCGCSPQCPRVALTPSATVGSSARPWSST